MKTRLFYEHVKKIRKVSAAFCILLLTTVSVNAASLVSGTLTTLDSGGVARNPPIFNNLERIGFQYNVTNSVSKTGYIQFNYSLADPKGRVVFTQQGNAISASQTGSGGTSISGVPVSQFYNTPGTYNLTATAKYSDNSESVTATLAIQIFSPILNLLYPPDHTQNLSDQPVTFRWIGTGATKYRVTVAENPSLFNPLLTSDVFGVSQFIYPANPSDPRQRLSSGKNYYWSVTGLDALGTQTSAAAYPYSFTIAAGASSSQSKDLAITSIDPSLASASSPDQMLINVKVKNLGGRSESNVQVSVYVQGTSQGKQSLDSINTSEEKSLTFSIYPPKTQTGTGFLVSANLEGFFDDNLMNNSLTRQISWPTGGSSAKAKITGGVWMDGGDGGKKYFEGATISYDGPAKGRVTTDNGGQYKIEDLPLGDYSLTAKAGDYPETAPMTVSVTEGVTYASRDFKIVSQSGVKSDSFSKKGTEDRAKVSDAVLKVVPDKVAKDLQGYQLDSIDAPGLSDSELSGILSGIADGSIKITSAVIQ